MRRLVFMFLVMMLAAGLTAGCGGSNTDSGKGKADGGGDPGTAAPAPAGVWADGHYYAAGEFSDSGWQDVVALKVENGKIVKAAWNALHREGGLDKKTSSELGFYGMAAKGGAQAEWHEQAAKMEQALIEAQSPEAIAVNDDGKTDAVSGVSVTVGGFLKLAAQALEAGPVEPGPYKDGTYFAEADEFDPKSGWKEHVYITVINGNIAAVSWNGTHKDGGTDKVTRSRSGEYGMAANGGAQAEWHEQAHKAEQYLLEKQDPLAIPYNPGDGKTDAISGVSIHVDGFVELAAKALEQAK